MKKPEVGYWDYRYVIGFLLLSFATPIIAWAMWGFGEKLERSGGMMVLFAATAEFIFTHKMHNKHIQNAKRLEKGEEPWDFSSASNSIGAASLVFASLGTLLWGVGEPLMRYMNLLPNPPA